MVACRIARFRGLIRRSDSEIGFGTKGTLESVCARLRDRSTIINEPQDSAVFGWVRFAAVCCGGRTCGLDRESDLEIGFSTAWELWLVWRLAGHGMGTAGFRRFRMSADCVQSAELSVSMN